MKRVCLTTIIVVAAVALAGLARAQLFGPKMKKPSELIQKQAPMKVNQDLLKQATPENAHIVVSIPKQRAYLMIGEEIVAKSVNGKEKMSKELLQRLGAAAEEFNQTFEPISTARLP